MAYRYACNKLVPDAQCDNSMEIASLQGMLTDFAKKVLEELTRWRNPKKELPENGQLVLCKTSNKKLPFVTVKYDRSGWWVYAYPGWAGIGHKIIGWRPICENE